MEVYKLLLADFVFSGTEFWAMVVGVILAVALLLSMIFIYSLRQQIKKLKAVVRKDVFYFDHAIERIPFNDNNDLAKQAYLLAINKSVLGDDSSLSVEDNTQSRKLPPSLPSPESARDSDTSPDA